MKVRLWNKLESFVRREEQQWSNFGKPSKFFSHPTLSEATKPLKPIPFRV